MTDFLRAVWHALTWRKLLAMQALTTLQTFAHGFDGRGAPLPTVLLYALSAPVAVVVILGADEALRRRTSPRVVYALTGLALLLGACTVYWTAYALGGPRAGYWDGQWQHSIAPILDVGLLAALALTVYLKRTLAQRTLAGLRDSELQRVQCEHRLVAAQLATTEAQVNPQMLFNALTDVRDRLIVEAPEADEVLAALIQRLRNAMARTQHDIDAPAIRS